MYWALEYLGVVAAVLAFYFRTKFSKSSTVPPGPNGLPFFGSGIFFGAKPHLSLQKYTKHFGDTFRLFFGNQSMIVMSDFNTIRKVFAQDSASGRNNLGKPGLLNSQGDLWKLHRRFALSTLRNLGMGKNWMEETILTEVEDLCQALRASAQQPCNPKLQLKNSVANVICALLFGQRFALTDPKLSLLTALIEENTDIIKWRFISQTLPFLMWFPNLVKKKVLQARRNLVELNDFLKDRIREHDLNRDQQEQVPDYLHAYQRERTNEQRTVAERETFTEKQHLASLLDLFSAGTDTASTTILWALVFMVQNPEVMKKAQAEIDENVGRDRQLRNSDRNLLPYTEALILETQRYSSVLPIGLPHKNLEEITIDGYVVPAGTLLAANLYAMHHDPRWWRRPDQFDPSQFLDASGKVIRPEGFAPFSIGKRACPGEALAKMELFLFIANLLRCFTLETPQARAFNVDHVSGATLSPGPFELIFIPRCIA